MSSTLTKRLGYGVQLLCNTSSNWHPVTLGAIVDVIEGPTSEAEAVDTTIFADKFGERAQVTSQVDPGELTFSIVYDPNDNNTTATLTALLQSGYVATWVIEYPATGTEGVVYEQFLGPLVGFKRTTDEHKMIIANVTVAISGTPGYTGG